jgi:hypothetical protein
LQEERQSVPQRSQVACSFDMGRLMDRPSLTTTQMGA